MAKSSGTGNISRWLKIILKPDNEEDFNEANHSSKEKKTLIDDLPRFLYEDLKRLNHLFTAPCELTKDYPDLDAAEKALWKKSAGDIPAKLKSLNLFIRRYSSFCRTCIITHTEVEKLASLDFEKWRLLPGKNENYTWPANFSSLNEKKRRFFMELNYLLPGLLKKAGFEIIRQEEIAGIDDKMVIRIARAIHARYLHELRRQHSEETGMTEFDDLPDDVKYSNIDNAWHIPTKLLAIGYRIRKVKKGHKPFALHLDKKEIEIMSGIEHLRWSWDKRLNGWTYGKTKDNLRKSHPGLVPYQELSESEKEKDRELIRMIPAILQDIDYEAYPVNPNKIKKLSYAIKPQSSINRILEETRELNEQIRGMVRIPPEVEKMVSIRNKKIEEAINEIGGSYTYARHIQEAFLPADLYIRECFADSFILYKPKDIVSGDFYFFSKRNGHIIFGAADCTGHGIPGAFLSIIGYGIIDQAVNELKLTEPHLILNHLYSRVHRFLRHQSDDTGIQDDMDIVLCTLNLQNNLLKWAGIGNSLYRISNCEILEYKSNNVINSVKDPGDNSFVSDNLNLKTGDLLYLCSDGFIDQFGGENHKKYSSQRFKNFLLNISSNSMPEQSDMLYEELEHWREANNEDQTDDILVIGIRI